MNIFESALRVYLFREALGMDILRRTLRPDVDYNVTVRVGDSVFEHNERAITVQGLAGVQTITVEDTRFLSNIAMHAGAGILLLTGKDLVIRRCTFDGNSAGNPRFADVLLHNQLVVISGEEANVHSKCCKGAVRLIGKGGAIRVQHGSATLENSTFRNNTARIAGGTIFVDRGSKLLVKSSHFSNADDRKFASQQGEIVYSNGQVNVDGGVFNIVSATSHISLFQHSGDRWSIEVYDISLRCPVGFRIRVTNTTSYRVVDTLGLKRSYMLDQLSYFCESCDRYKYSTDFGVMTYTLQYGVLDYFALMINEQHPEVSKEEQYYLHDIICKSCPYGGTCENRIRALPNFWGYQVGSAVTFQLCPKGYCCANPTACVSFSTCAPHRRGTLCGVCQHGYSEALFSPKCVPDGTCGPIWIWPFAFGTGILYFLFLLFQKDIREFIFSGDLNTALKSVLRTKQEEPTPDIEDEERDSMMKMEVFASQPDLPVNANDNCPSSGGFPPAERRRENGEVVVMADDDFDGDVNGEQKKSSAGIGDDVSDKRGPDGVRVGNEDSEMDDGEPTPEPPKTDIGAIMLIMVMYYFQDAMLFNIKTITDKPETRFWSQLKTVLLGLFKFRLEVTQFVDNVCLLPGLTASQKLLAKTLMVPFVLLNFVIIFALHACVTGAMKASRQELAPPGEQPKRETFTTRISTGFMLALMFMYQQLATAAFQLLNCVVVGERNVLFLEGTITCYQDWQYGVIAYAVFGIIPFFFALMIGPGMLKERRISVGIFFCACVFPLPFFVYWIGRRAAPRCPDRSPAGGAKNDPETNSTESEAAVLKVLQGPFRELECRYTGPVCWAGVLVFRRLMLILFYTFINNSLIRIICMLCFSFLILIVHVHVQPYRDPRVNIAGSVSISALMIVGGINLIRASFEVAEYIPQGPNELLVSAMKESENVLMLWIPLITMTIIIVVCIYKILGVFWSKCTYCR
ncbi:hypothetical protein LSH36_156g13005 [Paralvinella palmiformis]|uniref:Right handed beta helix domain-containing protein n=1 Tax=Paralvinella palmiformis TaxID=53620 RepID=A0AAD9JTR4_9ANNE|nr:hypothetical protein LSH36_156g13005 [Paralvinella palmiformis]